ncbi:membrane protein insertion efficiency factor YidD [Oceanobacillus sp. FSL K6-0251]|uniref:membrane protein insertion efficiency factor YidD n=1 Tax=Oceanobacillus sp. FSL K6-0251 TaxID=2921602 RepID=UPI0030FBB5D7
MLSKILISFVRFYQLFISPIKPKRVKCRFYPTCSKYAILSIQKYGAIKGVKNTINRLKRCRPDNTESCIDYP